MKTIRNTISILTIIVILVFLVFNRQVTDYINTNLVHIKDDNIYLKVNDYAKRQNYKLVVIEKDYTVSNYRQLLDVLYTVLDSGVDEFTFYCEKSYDNCLDDINKIISDESEDDIMAELNNFVHPYNTYKNITIVTTSNGKITIHFEKIYSKQMINEINTYIDNFIAENITDKMSDYEKILLFHDYIINNTSYDIERANDVNSEIYKNSPSHTAYGVIKNNVALCGGYSDIMAIYLNKIGIKNIKIAAKLHVWNLVYFDGKWLHLDATWDDPVTNTGEQLLIHEYFLIDSEKLLELDNIEHQYNKDIYKEAN